MKRPWVIASGVATVAVAAVLAGAIPVKASSGHLAITSFVLDLVKRRSVATRAWAIDTPPLDDEGLVRLGAAHFDRGCRPCHGAPGERPPAVPLRMTPHPPDLPRQVGRWRPRELFYLIAHGIKFTGMPAWPSPSRTDEAWAVVAFLRRLPALDAASYRRLARREPGAVAASSSGLDAEAALCRTCHAGDVPLAPRLSSQSTVYVADALDAYAEGRRYSGIMQPIAVTLDHAARRRLAAAMTAPTDGDGGPPASPASAAAPGAALLVGGDPSREIPPCLECHAATARPRDPRYPVLAGLSASYLHLQLTLFAEGRRGGSPSAEIMRPIASRLTPPQRELAANAFAALDEGRR